MPDFKEVLTQHKEKLGEGTDQTFANLSTKLNELGYDVLLNARDKAEFIPSGRLNEVVAQREQFKNKVEELNGQLESMKVAAQGNAGLQKQLQEQIDANNKLLSEVEVTKTNAEILLAAKDANNPHDVLAFINKDAIKVDKRNGNVTGIKEEIERIRKEKPYLFAKVNNSGGFDGGGSGSGSESFNMNAMIRRAAGK